MSGIQNDAFDLSTDNNEINELELRKVESDQNESVIIEESNSTSIKENSWKNLSLQILIHAIIIFYFFYVLIHFVSNDTCTQNCKLTLCSSYGIFLLLFTTTYIGLLYFKILKPRWGNKIYLTLISPLKKTINLKLKKKFHRIILISILVIAFVAYLIYETHNDLLRLRALVGIAIFISIGYFISSNPKQINWRPVICGGVLQFLLGILFIRWPIGRQIFECLGKKVSEFLEFGKDGAKFVYGDFLVFDKGVFAFAVLPTIFFFSLCISVSYYIGAMQWVLFKLGWILQSLLGTTICESCVSAGNIFLGMSESPLIITPFINKLTESEIHAVMVSGFSTVSGSVMVAYISFGAEASHLITASIMAAPASLFFSKLVFPETEESQTSSSNIQLEKSSDKSILDAASNGASQAISLVLNIIANLVAFVAFISFADGMIRWLAGLAGFPEIDIAFILSKLFKPICYMIGIDWKDTEAVGNIIGTKTIINEFVAFKLLGDYKKANTISARSSAISTFAICSFANPASIGIMIGALSSLAAQEKRGSITKVAFRAFVSACFVTLITASIAGLLLTDEIIAEGN